MKVGTIPTILTSALLVVFVVSCMPGAEQNPAQPDSVADVVTVSDPDCPHAQVAAVFKQAVLDAGGRLEPIHIENGLAVLATAETEEGVAAIRTAALAHLASDRAQASSATAGEAISPACAQIMEGIRTGQLRQSVAETEQGALLTLSTADAALATTLHNDSCCNYCTNCRSWRCASCC